MKLPGLKLSKDEVSQEFDLNKVLGMDVSKDQGLQEAIGQAIIDRIVERTERGKSVSGAALPKYSKAYKESLEFAAFGKTNKVNMTLTGEMLSSLTVLSASNGRLKIGFDGEENNAKAFGHISGMEGHPTLEGKVPEREFFGLTKAEIESIRKEFRPQLSDEAEANDNVIIGKIKKLIGE